MRMHLVIVPTSSGEVVDHCNRNTLDNRRCNLRRCTPQQNIANSKKRSTNQTGYKGVSKLPKYNQWRAVIRRGGKQVHLGYFRSDVDAAKAYDSAASELYGSFAKLNFRKELA